ncbi:hypothetical protein Tco_0899241 [Tanacetum coccineum]
MFNRYKTNKIKAKNFKEDEFRMNCLEYDITALDTADSITTQTCEISQEFNDFLALYPFPSEYLVILAKSNQTVFDSPPRYVWLYTYSFSLANLRLPLTEFFCEVLEYFQVHISRLNPFGCAKLTTFVVICKAYGCEPSVDLFRGFFNLSQASNWLTFAKRSKKHIPNLLPKVITRIEGWHERLQRGICGSLKPELFVNPGSVAAQIKDRKRSRKLLQVIEKLRGECDVMRSRERARDEECEGLRVKCEAAMTDFEKNPAVVALQEKISALSTEAKEHKLEAVEVSLRKEVEELKQYRREVVSKVVPYAAMKLVHSDDMGSLVGKLVFSAIVYRRCRAFEQVAGMKEPFDLSKVKGYRSSYKKDHTQASNNLATATYPWLDEFMADPSAPIEALLSKKPSTLQRPAPSRTQVPLVSSQRDTPSSIPASNPMSPPAYASVMKPQSSPPQ